MSDALEPPFKSAGAPCPICGEDWRAATEPSAGVGPPFECTCAGGEHDLSHAADCPVRVAHESDRYANHPFTAPAERAIEPPSETDDTARREAQRRADDARDRQTVATPRRPLGPPSESPETIAAIDRARLEMVDALHRVMFGETFARPQSPQDVWLDMLERIDRARRQFHR